jgi:hypothetical protein
MDTQENPAAVSLSDAVAGATGTNVLRMCATRFNHPSWISTARNTPPGRSTRKISANACCCAACVFKWCNTSTAIAVENVFSGNGNAEASPCSTAPFVLCRRRAIPTAKAWLYSRLVTRVARFRSSSVAAPGPAPISRTFPPNSVPDKIHGSTRFRVTLRQMDEPQNQFSNRFTKARPIFNAKPVASFQERVSVSEIDYRKPGWNLATGRGYRSIGPMRRSEAAN